VERLIWLRDVRLMALRDYRLQKPLALPRGTRIQVAASPGAMLQVLCD
jgi:hypothetical protein